MNFATKEIKAEDFFDDVEDEAGPPHLSRETFDKNEEEDNFVEMEDDDDEVDCPIPVCKPGTAIARRAKNFQEEDQNIDLDEAYPISGAKNRRLKFDYDQSKYSVQYRDSQFKSNAKNSHKVAIVIKHDENICHEFSYNRTAAGDGSKYYTCLGCRKAKIETYKDVIRTIRIDDTYGQILSKGDPFGGHHYQCQPLAWTPDARSYGHVHPQPMHMDLGEYAPSEYVYLDGDGMDGIWDPASNSLLNIASIPFYGEQGPPQISSIKKEAVETIKKPSRVHERPAQFLSFYQRQMRKKRLSQSHKPRCHICTRTLPSTESLIIHLQRHLDRAESSVKTRSFI